MTFLFVPMFILMLVSWLYFGFMALFSDKYKAKQVLRIAVVAIPMAMGLGTCTFYLLQGKKESNEACAIAALRTMSSAEELYFNRYKTYATLSQLAATGVDMIDGITAAAIDPQHEKGGYYYILTVGHDGKTWCCIARPAAWGKTGQRNFWVFADGAIYYSTKENKFTSMDDFTPENSRD